MRAWMNSEMSIERLDPGAAGRELMRRIDALQPTACIRLGDGEGVVLGQPDFEHPMAGPYLRTHFGAGATQADLDGMAARMRTAVRRAWVIGIRQDVLDCELPSNVMELGDEERVAVLRAQPALREIERERMEPEAAYRLVLLHQVMKQRIETNAIWTSAWCHFDWLESGLLAEIVVNQEHIGLVSGQDKLAEVIRSSGVEVDYWPVPARYIRRGAEWTPHFPARYEALLDTLAPAFPGQVVLVGAGILGKVYCDVIAARGGIGIDVGAVCDAWLGISSRPMVALDRWDCEDIPESFLLRNQLACARHLAGQAQRS